MIKIRFAKSKDAEMIADLSRQTFYESFAAHNTPENMQKFLDEQFTRNALIKEVTAPNNIFFLAYENEDVLGYVRMRVHNNPPSLGKIDAIELARIYVIQSAIGRGVGRLLMQTAIEVAREERKKMIWLGVWEHNHRAIDFYTRWGFEKFAEHEFLLGDDAQNDWLMKKVL